MTGVSTGRFRRMHGQSPHILMRGTASGAAGEEIA